MALKPKAAVAGRHEEAPRILGGKIEEGTEGANPKEGPTFAQAFTGAFKNADGDATTGYLEYLKATAKPTSKWPYNVERLGETILLPKWGKWSLIEMGKRPMAFKEWYLSLADNPTNANRCVGERAYVLPRPRR